MAFQINYWSKYYLLEQRLFYFAYSWWNRSVYLFSPNYNYKRIVIFAVVIKSFSSLNKRRRTRRQEWKTKRDETVSFAMVGEGKKRKEEAWIWNGISSVRLSWQLNNIYFSASPKPFLFSVFFFIAASASASFLPF